MELYTNKNSSFEAQGVSRRQLQQYNEYQ